MKKFKKLWKLIPEIRNYGERMPSYIKKDSDRQKLLRLLLEATSQGFSIIDENLDILAVNRAAMEILDIPVEVFEKNSKLEQVVRFNAERGEYGPGDPDEQVRQRIELALKFEPHDFERLRPGGRIIRIQGTPIEGGGFVTIYRDVTKERQQERELLAARTELSQRLDDRTRQLEENRDLLFHAVNAIRDGLGIANSSGEVILANEKMKKIFPHIEESIEKKENISDVIRSMFHDDSAINGQELLDIDRSWKEQRFPDGRWYRVNRTRSFDGGLIFVFSEITAYKKQQANLQSHTDELVRLLQQEKKISEMQREFVSMASHEFRTPLAIIDSNAHRIQRRSYDIEPEKIRVRVQRIRNSVDRMQYLINRFLGFSKAQYIGLELDIQKQPFRSAVEDVCENFSQSSTTHTISLDTAHLPEEYEYDQKLLEHCIVNLLSNAVKYSPDVTEVKVLSSDREKFFEIIVSDGGVGIPKRELSRVFDKYYRASTSSGIPGTGIGLSMAAEVVEKHHGKLKILSDEGQGTQVSIRLPKATKKKRKPRNQP